MNARSLKHGLSAVICGVVLFAAPSSGFAGGSYNNGDTPAFQGLDADRDGAISREEAKQHQQVNNRFSELDQDDDKEVTRAEFAEFEVLQNIGP